VKYFQNNIGFGYQDSEILVFFGNKNGEHPALEKEFPDFQFLRVKQTHSDIFVEASTDLKDADAHGTAEKNKALLIATADCMPIMIYCEQTRRAAAVHAGWRGVANGILEKTLNQLIFTGSDLKQFRIFCGPSIQQNSFEVDRDVFDLIKQKSRSSRPESYSYQKNSKFYVNLNQIAQNQIMHTSGCMNSVFSTIDTKTDENYYSYRRGKLRSERNLSFICLLT
jgi:YfiH family protein